MTDPQPLATQVVDLVTVQGPPDFVALGVKVLEDVKAVNGADVLTQLLGGQAAEVRYVQKIGAPAPVWAKGYWRSGPRRAAVRQLRRSDGKPKYRLLRYLTVHELLGHGSDDSVLDGKRRACRFTMTPRPSSWDDVDGATGMDAYWRLPSEAYADALAMELLGLTESPYSDDYLRDVQPGALLPIVLDPPDPVDVEPPTIPVPEPPPVDIDVLRAAWHETDLAIRSSLDDFGLILG